MSGQLALDLTGRDQASRNTDDWWRSTALTAIREMAARNVSFQAWDLVAELGLAEPDSPARWGPVFALAAKRGLIVHVGYAPSRRPTVAGSAVKVWRGVPR